MIATLIYLDQNILSDLRDRKLKEMNDKYMLVLKHVLLSSKIQVVYSHITLAEINQISNDVYKIEHIDLLEELGAKYIEPRSKKLSHKAPSQVWTDYMENLDSSNDVFDFQNIALSVDNLSRKGAGLPIESSFKEIGNNLENDLQNLSKTIIDLLNIDFNEEDLKEPFKSNATQIKSLIEQMKKDLPRLLNNRPSIANKFTRLDNLPLGPKPFREYKPIKDLNVSNLASSEVVLAIENVFNRENPTSSWRNNSNDTLEDKIAISYSLMNWAGYYPDDFDKIKKNRDRFRASNNDMQHAVMASRATFLISNDNAFRMKAIASYEYASSGAIVCSAQSFLEEHYKYMEGSQ